MAERRAPDEMWQGEDVHEYDGRHNGSGWRLKVCKLTMDVLVCMTDGHCPYREHPEELPGQILHEGDRWVGEFVAFVTLRLCVREAPRSIVSEAPSHKGDLLAGLYSDICAARYAAMEWLREMDDKIGERARSTQQHYDKAIKDLHETQQQVGLLPTRMPPTRLPS